MKEIQQTQKFRVLCLGDSVTDGFWLPGGYRNTLCSLLAENGLASSVQFLGPICSGSGYDNRHAGYSGFATEDIADSVSGPRIGIAGMLGNVLQCGTPDAVFLQIGTNDILSLYELDRFGERLNAICQRLLAAMPQDGLLCIGLLPPLDAADSTYMDPRFFTAETADAAVAQCNAQIRSTAASLQKNGRHVLLAEAGALLTKQDLKDGVHPTAAGYEKLGRFWFGILTSELRRRRSMLLSSAAVPFRKAQ